MDTELQKQRRNTKLRFYLEIDGRNAGLTFSATHFIGGHGTCGNLHGHDYAVNVRMGGSLDADCMVSDFIIVEKSVKDILNRLDHKIIVARRYAELDNGRMHCSINDGTLTIPANNVCIIDVDETTAESLAQHILSDLLEDNYVKSRSISFISIGVCESGTRTGWCETGTRPQP